MASNLHALPDSPCIGVCSTLFDEVCKGCGRTAGEVFNWVFMSDEEKRAVWTRIEQKARPCAFRTTGCERFAGASLQTSRHSRLQAYLMR
ncbi:MAG: Phosphoenolpyruvate synthase (EC [uncultured Paraburkholderia sp.]|nr:MAG: Phosphoenolpyruvate synthase (EC [uncultured Paraburkholderia sp.]